MCLLISCESGGQRVPEQLIENHAVHLSASPDRREQRQATPRNKHAHRRSPPNSDSFASLPESLSHDAAARYAARRIAERLQAPLIQHDYSLDLIDVTRSLRHRRLYSSLTRGCDEHQKAWLIDHVYQPYRDRVRSAIGQQLCRQVYVVHLSIRSFDQFSPKQKRRRADVGLLYDPAVVDEVDLCADWLEEMYFGVEMLKVRRNYPRRGTVDSLTRAMRTEFSGQNYLGVEVLLNRAWAARDVALRDEAIDAMCTSLQAVLQPIQNAAA
ncbi:MAG: N-formylglutamate amidohydrolase [Pirellulaceae bacterium]|nr:N-formylglutamate amidohydrolase [Pirellulaceae bacterium]